MILGFVPYALAQEFVPLAGIPGLTQGVDTTSGGLAVFFNNLYKYLIGIAAILTIIVIIYEGIKIATNQGNVSMLMDGKSRIWQAILGLVLVLSPVLVFSIINPSILNLSLNLPVLDTATKTENNGNVTQRPTTVDVNGCIVREGEFLETAVCPTKNIASSYDCKNGLKPTATACETFDAQGHEHCLSFSVYCGFTITVTYYQAVYNLTGADSSSDKVVPRDVIAENTFASGCNADGGEMKKSTSLISKVFHYTGNCASDTNIPDFTSSPSGLLKNYQRGFECYDRTLSCQPPQ